MRNELREIFSRVRAEEDLKERTKAYVIGQAAARRRRKAAALRLVPAAACLALILLGGWRLAFSPTAHISIDVNPSLELGVNRFDRVVSVKGVGEDGEELAQSLSLWMMDYGEAVDRVLDSGTISDLLAQDQVLSIAVVAPEGQQAQRLLSGVRACAQGRGQAYCYSARPEEVEAAHEAGLSYGKYRAFLTAQELDPSLTPEDVQGMTMREIRDLIASLSGEEDGSPARSGRSRGQGKGGGRQRE